MPEGYDHEYLDPVPTLISNADVEDLKALLAIRVHAGQTDKQGAPYLLHVRTQCVGWPRRSKAVEAISQRSAAAPSEGDSK